MYKLAAVAAICFFSFILWVIYLANSGSNSIFFDFVRSFPYGDKLGHLCLFGILTLFVIVATRFRSFSTGSLRIYFGAAIVVIFVLGEEMSQAFIPGRSFDLVDLSADIIGILTFTYVATLIDKRLTENL
ncbi:MAG: VanZ family protein [Gammaproteobacteria bacterium]|jgi:VanZ family protein|nr:VanZ family protein [Gammaproteobacteria bacterium]MBT4860696.1 VanZ family protein [Gammaproteobacteria bacterium]MBT6552271.1 VanZ family protein [Gammaproteobacteria bacterium]